MDDTKLAMFGNGEAVEMVMERLEGMDNGTVPCDNA